MGGTKLERFLPKNQPTQRKLLNFENWVNGDLSKVPKFDLLLNLFFFFIEEYQFRSTNQEKKHKIAIDNNKSELSYFLFSEWH